MTSACALDQAKIFSLFYFQFIQEQKLASHTCFLILFFYTISFKRVSPNLTTMSLPPHSVPHTGPNALRIGPVLAVSWSLVDDTAKVQIS